MRSRPAETGRCQKCTPGDARAGNRPPRSRSALPGPRACRPPARTVHRCPGRPRSWPRPQHEAGRMWRAWAVGGGRGDRPAGARSGRRARPPGRPGPGPGRWHPRPAWCAPFQAPPGRTPRATAASTWRARRAPASWRRATAWWPSRDGSPACGVVSVDHPGGLRTTYQPVTPAVVRGEPVTRGQVLGLLAGSGGHCPPAACLHWGLRRGATYLDPLALLGPVASRVRLLPVWSAGPATARRPPRPCTRCASRYRPVARPREPRPDRATASGSSPARPRSRPSAEPCCSGGRLRARLPT